MSRSVLSLLAMVALFAASPVAHAQEGPAGEKKMDAKPVCPISGKDIDKEVSIDAGGGKVYFCCPKCVKKYKADPAQYAEKVHVQQMIMGPPRVQVACPVSGKPIDKAFSTQHHGQTLYFCCGDCPKKFEKDPAKYMKNFDTAFTTQTVCPISGEDIDPAASLTLASKDERVFFCCKKCLKKFGEDRAKYGAKLAGFYLCPMKQCKDTGSLKASDCPKCGMHRKQIGKSAKSTKKADSVKMKEMHKGHDPAGHDD